MHHMTSSPPPARRPRGRPRRDAEDRPDARARLIRCGLERLTEGGFTALTVDDVLAATGFTKGSFYHHFGGKEAFAAAVLDAYADYFAAKLDRHLLATERQPLDRLLAFVDDAASGLARHAFRRGCLVGNLGQEASLLDARLCDRLEAILRDWEQRLATCLASAVAAGQLPVGTPCEAFAHAFWIGWEGAILRARLLRNASPLHSFTALFLAALTAPHSASPP